MKKFACGLKQAAVAGAIYGLLVAIVGVALGVVRMFMGVDPTLGTNPFAGMSGVAFVMIIYIGLIFTNPLICAVLSVIGAFLARTTSSK